MFFGCQDLIQTEQDICKNTPATRSTNNSYEYYYWCDGVKIPLSKNEGKYYILARSEQLESAQISTIKNIRNINNYTSLGIKTSKDIHKSLGLLSFTIDNNAQSKIKSEDIVYCAPYFKASDGSEIGITNIISVQLAENQSISKLQSIADECNLEILGENAFDKSVYYISCTKNSKGNALEMANYIYESVACKYATPEFILESKPDTNDPYFYNQWSLQNTTYPDYDIDYINTLTTFTFQHINDVIVAVIDNGIYTDHEDLPLHNVSYDAHTGESPSLLYGEHGTTVAGVIGATSNNNMGIAGIASGVKIMPISVCYSADSDRLGITASTSTQFANAIRFAADNGAHIINNSWSFNTSNPISNINSAIEYAQNKGCIVVFSSGNDNGTVSQPAAGSPAKTLVVGSTTRYGDRSSFSNYGSALDICAPGSDIWTTTWTGGYNKMNGTSYAAPHVSAIAGLMLSVNPTLTNDNICNILESTSHKLPNYIFSSINGKSNGTWNSEIGHGLVNSYDAVSLAYYFLEDSYTDLIEFDYSGEQVEMTLKVKNNIAVIWDWDKKDISFINADTNNIIDTTLTHTYLSSDTKHIKIAELIPPGESADTSSTALIEFDLSTGNYASNIEIKSTNSSLEYLRIIGGPDFTGSDIYINKLPALKELYLVQLQKSRLYISYCPALKYFGTSRQIWYHGNTIAPTSIPGESTISPNIVGDGGGLLPGVWPYVPESKASPDFLKITGCDAILALSLENVNFTSFSFSGLNNLSYVYLSSQDARIVGVGSSATVQMTKGYYLSAAVSSLPTKGTSVFPAKIVIRAVNSTNSAFTKVKISSTYKNNIQNYCTNNGWILVWDSGVQ